MIVHSKVALLSKPISFFDSVPYTCYECGHTWEPRCLVAFYHVVRDTMKFSIKIYFGFYLVSLLLKFGLHKKDHCSTKRLLKLVRNVIQSSLFFSSCASLFVGFYCVYRRIFGKYYWWHGFLIGFVDGCLSIHIERKSRRGLLALYLANLASETLFNMAVSRDLIQKIPNGEVLIFLLASAGFMSLYRRPNGLSSYLQDPLQYFVGKFESSDYKSGECSPETKDVNQNGVSSIIEYSLKSLKNCFRPHQLCKHSHSCLYYTLQGFARSFMLGYFAQVCLNLLQLLRGRVKLKSTVQSLLKLKTCSLGLFLGCYNALFRMCNCVLRWLTARDNATLHGALSGAVAGLSAFLYKSSSLSIYFLFKLIEVLAGKASDKGYLPRIPKANEIIYGLSLAVILQAACLEPHNIRPTYWKFLCTGSGEKMQLLNRKLFDPFGTHASKLYPSFFPNLDPKHVVSPDVVALMMLQGK